MKVLKMVVLAILMMATVSYAMSTTPKNTTNNTDPVYVIDVRSEAEWNEGHIKGALLLPKEKVQSEIGNITTDKSAKIYLYCRSGKRAGVALDILKKAGYQDLVNLGGINDAAKQLNREIIK